jgi:hypothetical protein
MGPHGTSGPAVSAGGPGVGRGLPCALYGLEDRPSMDRTNAGERAFATAPAVESEAIDFVRFCHRRRRVGWPELYDEMCAVAGRGLYRGYGSEELSSIGIAFGLFQMPALAGLVAQVVAEDVERRRRSAAAIRASLTGAEPIGEPAVAAPIDGATATTDSTTHRYLPEPDGAGLADAGPIRIAVAAGA